MTVGRVRTGVILIAIGVLLLLNTTGVADFGFWRWLGRLWPVIIIAIGIEKIFSSAATSNLRNLAWLSPVLIAGVVAFSVMAGEPSGDRQSWNWNWDDGWYSTNEPMSNSTWSEVLSPTGTRARLALDLSGGVLTIRGGSSAGNLLEARTKTRGEKPNIVSEIVDGIHTIRITQRRKPDRQGREQWNLKLTDSIPIEFSIDGGAARMRLDLAEIKAESVNLDVGAADVDMVFGSLSKDLNCQIDCGAAAIDITIPAEAGLRLERESVLSGLSSADLELVDRGDYSETVGFDSAPVKIRLTVNSAVSSLRLRRAVVGVSNQSI